MKKFIFIFLVFMLGVSFIKPINKPTIKSIKKENPKNIVCLHGFMGNNFHLSLLRYNFRKEGYRVYKFSYPSRQKYIKEHAKALVELLNDISKKSPNEPINFVTHSMGGLVLRVALNEPNCPKEAKIGKAVLIAPPNRGAIIARKLYELKFPRKILGNKAGMELMQKENFDDFGKFPESMKVLVISGTFSINPLLRGVNDGTICLKETCLQTKHKHITVKAGHTSLCFAPRVIREAKKFLKE